MYTVLDFKYNVIVLLMSLSVNVYVN
jgi:hypothetical protein